ncbi:hypothetical protein LMG27952_04165 [Paraburkholderia hiiakae]|uniref:Uncharacterized protein n=1 Tax=Paraburkholderia hiiakae TaxID=1081782 RepID=A0ABM8NUW5_9BURK|nr:hypothetical protein [Paraburkholderia hiiakae]CAD6544628.1 hypothetical protein LMG27952_04165 [Paraburkholderia hiiakae]
MAQTTPMSTTPTTKILAIGTFPPGTDMQLVQRILPTEIRETARKIGVVGVHVGFVDTDLTKDFDVPKFSPVDVVRQAYDALEAGESEVLADAGSRELKQSLSAAVPGYIDPTVLQA